MKRLSFDKNKCTGIIINAICLGMSHNNDQDEIYITFDQSYLQHLLFDDDLPFLICFYCYKNIGYFFTLVI